MAQPVQLVDRLCSSGRGPVEGGQKVFLSPSGLLFPVKVEPQPVELATNQGEHGDQVEPRIPIDDTEREYDGYDASDPVTYQEAVHCPQFTSWKEAMNDEMNSMYMNGVWDLVELSHGCKPVGYEEVYMEQPAGFVEIGKENLVCKLNKSIYGLKQASSGSSYIFLVLYVDDILLASNDSDLLIETKHMLLTHFDMKDLGEASYVLGIKILRDRANEVLKLSQRTYIEKILKKFSMQNCSSSKTPIVKGDKFSKTQCPQNDDEREEMRTIPYSSLVVSLMYAQVCTRPDIAFVVGMLGRYLSNPGSQH
ncbi:Retrovirus-related Pol polyprotein from transposon TNT 1-94 [Vitis vinifera]|uniref:Retrovirus-related Pol polyprotein from transposon TNT 1-94 n=1 Tax=Vitis vinifera TaxID=29760 RepID=A0A438FJI5_VITVI|nr:Retrovirus-related Pol polyprotein from transposon TNT 1-94 [Vitis vinifera]